LAEETHPEDECNQVSHETIYRAYLYKHVACSRKSCSVTFDRSARCVAPSRLIEWR